MHTTIDSKMFHPILTLQDRAQWLASLHPRGADYINQAPALVAASMAYDANSIRQVFTELCERGERLGVILDVFGLNRGLRSVSAKALRVSHAHELIKLKVMNASTLVQQLDARDLAQQTAYLDLIKPLSEWATGNLDPVFAWMMERIPLSYPDMAHIRDYFRSEFGARWRVEWKWRDFLAGMKHWEDDFAKAKAREEAKYNIPLTPHSQAPRTFEWKGHTFKLLNTENELRLEGAHMHHCVGGYHTYVKNGTSLIYAVSLGEARKGTLELRANPYNHLQPRWIEETTTRTPVIIYDEQDKQKHPEVKKWQHSPQTVTRYRWTINQFKTYSNAAPDGAAQNAAKEFMTEGFLYPEEIKAREEAKKRAEEGLMTKAKKILKAG